MLFCNLKVEFCANLYGEWTYIVSCHQCSGVSAAISYQIGTWDGTLGTRLIEEINEVDIEGEIFVVLVACTCKCFPSAFEIHRVAHVGILLAKVAERCPDIEAVVCIAWV